MSSFSVQEQLQLSDIQDQKKQISKLFLNRRKNIFRDAQNYLSTEPDTEYRNLSQKQSLQLHSTHTNLFQSIASLPSQRKRNYSLEQLDAVKRVGPSAQQQPAQSLSFRPPQQSGIESRESARVLDIDLIAKLMRLNRKYKRSEKNLTISLFYDVIEVMDDLKLKKNIFGDEMVQFFQTIQDMIICKDQEVLALAKEIKPEKCKHRTGNLSGLRGRLLLISLSIVLLFSQARIESPLGERYFYYDKRLDYQTGTGSTLGAHLCACLCALFSSSIMTSLSMISSLYDINFPYV